MRKQGAALALAAFMIGANLGVSRMRATSSRDNASTGGVPLATSFIYPVGAGASQPTWTPGNANGYFITQGFNNSCDPSLGQGYYLSGFYYCGHTGIDLASAAASDVVHATAAGIVVEAGYLGGYGVMVRIKHYLPDGAIVYSQYEHMAYGSLSVYTGQIVAQGQELGLVGATGFATGAHLHFEIKSPDEDGVGYTFGNDALIAGYFEPLSFVASHQAQPTVTVIGPGHAVPVWPAESDVILQKFLGSYQHFVVVKISDGLNVRSGPGTHYKVLGVALRGAKLGYLQTSGKWLNVALPQNVKGWVSQDYVAGYQDWNHAASAHPAWPPAGPVATVVDSLGLNVRAAPGQNHPVISSAYKGDQLALLTRTTNWAQVRTRDGAKGWVLRRYLQEPGQPRPHAATVTIDVAASVLNVRGGPGLQYPVTGSVFHGTQMQLVNNTPNWAAVILPGGTTGWVARDLTSDPPTLATMTRQPTAQQPVFKAARHVSRTTVRAQATYVTVMVSVLNIRSGPGQSHPVIARALLHTRLQVVTLTTHWAHVALPASRIDGWVLRSLTG